LLLDKDGVFAGKETLDAWLPGVVENGNAISIAHLLTNSSGIPNYLEIVKAQPDQYDVLQPRLANRSRSRRASYRFTDLLPLTTTW
jgi:CubicO group peptidase (beta-lactamase class C family)